MKADASRDALENEQERVIRDPTREFLRAVNRLTRAVFERDLDRHRIALRDLKQLIGNAMAAADLSGRRYVLRQAAAFDKKHGWTERQHFAAIEPVVPLTVAETVALFYVQWHADSIGAFIDANVVQRVADSVEKGRDSAVAVLQDVGGWSHAYAQTVYRTNLSSAQTAGQFQQLADPIVLEVMPALELNAIGDRDTRPNHQAASGLLAAVHDPIWEIYAKPLGYQCRCGMRHVDRFECEQRGLLKPDGGIRIFFPPNFADAHPDPGFGIGRPDKRIYGSSKVR